MSAQPEALFDEALDPPCCICTTHGEPKGEECMDVQCAFCLYGCPSARAHECCRVPR